MTTRSTNTEQVTLLARVTEKDNGFVATVEGLTLTGDGDTVEEAQDDLVAKFMSWVQACDGQESLESALSEAGYSNVDEDTELQLQFVE